MASIRSKLLIFLASFLIVSGCGPRVKSYPTLANKGILPLSTDNPYMGGNLFIAEEAEHSDVLFNFLETQGAPTAIELVQRRFSSPKLLLYYARNMQVYSAVPVTREMGDRVWVVSGPYAVNRRDFKDMRRLAESTHGDPIFVIEGEKRTFRQDRRAVEATHVLLPKLPPPPSPKPVTKKKVTAKKPVAAPTPTPEPTVARPANLDQQAIAMSQGYAERAPNGDLIHTVKHENETLATIVKWYTDSPDRAAEIAKQNNIESTGAVAQGTRITIPSAALKKFKIMPPDFK
jgi:hypothetical protein